MDSEVVAGITAMDFYDITLDGTKEIILGFDDGTVQVYAIDPDNYQDSLPRLILSQVRTRKVK